MTLKFYQNLGKLFYAIVAGDNKVHEAEMNKLKELVKKEWLNIDDIEDEFGIDAAYQIELHHQTIHKLQIPLCKITLIV